MLRYKICNNIQHSDDKFGNVFRIYKKMIDGKTHIKFERDKVFGDNNAAPPINESIGQTIVAAAHEVRKELSTTMGGGGG